MKKCPNCGAPIEHPGDTMCAYCGSPLQDDTPPQQQVTYQRQPQQPYNGYPQPQQQPTFDELNRQWRGMAPQNKSQEIDNKLKLCRILAIVSLVMFSSFIFAIITIVITAPYTKSLEASDTQIRSAKTSLRMAIIALVLGVLWQMTSFLPLFT